MAYKRDWEKVWKDWQGSGISKKKFCRQHAIPLGSFYINTSRFRQLPETDVSKLRLNPLPLPDHLPKFLQLVVDDPVGKAVVLKITTPSGCTIEVPL